jgi:hypothetical protein
VENADAEGMPGVRIAHHDVAASLTGRSPSHSRAFGPHRGVCRKSRDQYRR